MEMAVRNLKQGDELPRISKVVTLEKMKVFSAWSGKSIHTDDEVARKWGFPRAVAQANMLYAYLAEVFISFFGEDWLKSGSMDVVFMKPVFTGDKISTKVIVQSKDLGETTKINFNVACDNQDGETVAAGTASVIIHE